ncbi:MAG: nucleotidyltransferase domain-containing protein [Candidatus Dependentiae bacterium]
MIKYKDKMIRILKALFPDAKIILFGSRARGDARENSDIDIAIDAGKQVSPYDIVEAKNIFSEMNIIFKVDVVDYQSVSEILQKQIDKDGVLWSD